MGVPVISSQVSYLHPRWRGRWTKSRRLYTAWEALRQHNPAQLITHRFPLHNAAAAYQLLNENAASAIQPILHYD